MNRVNFGYADAHMVPRQMAAGPADWREALDIVALGLPEQVCAVTYIVRPPLFPPLMCSLFFPFSVTVFDIYL
jgi:hypothetical protein